MANSLSEGFARMTYVGDTGVHHLMLPVNYDGTPTAGVEPSLTTKGATSVAAEVGFGEFLDAIEEIHNDSTLYGLVEFYSVNPTTEERTFIYAYNAARTGVTASPTVDLSMLTSTFKTIGGGLLKIVLLDTVLPVNTKFRPPYVGGGSLEQLANYIVSADSIAIGRDDTYAFSPISTSTKTSDALRKRAGL